MTVELAHIEVINGLIKRQGQAISIIAQAVARGKERPKKRHVEACECFTCRDNRKWEQRFDALYAEEMRAYYRPVEPRAGVSASGLKEASYYAFTSPTAVSKIQRKRLAENHR